MPIAFLMGVEWDDCPTVASLLGTKMFINEFVAYQELSKLIQNRQQCITPSISVSDKKIYILNYALYLLVLKRLVVKFKCSPT